MRGEACEIQKGKKFSLLTRFEETSKFTSNLLLWMRENFCTQVVSLKKVSFRVI